MNTAKIITLVEKMHHSFKSYPSTNCKTVLFPGCSLSSQFPRTIERLSQLCHAAGSSVVYDCCGGPLEEFGRKKPAQRVLRNLDRRLLCLGCKRLVLACPMCCKHLTGLAWCAWGRSGALDGRSSCPLPKRNGGHAS